MSVFCPRKCLGCGQPAEEGLFCIECREALVQPLWLSGGAELDGTALLFRYDGPLKEVLRKIKFSRQKNLLDLLAREFEMAAPLLPVTMKHILADTNTVIVPVPTAACRRKERGFDIPLVLFEHLAVRYKFCRYLERSRDTMPQYGLNPEERKINIEDCFVVLDVVDKKNIVVVDDIFTTGATMEEAARTLKAYGAANVYGMALCGSIENYAHKKLKIPNTK